MNYKYKIEEKEIVFSPEEHATITKAIEKGQTIIFLRDRGIAINTSFIRWVHNTEEMTAVEEKRKMEHLALPPDERVSKKRNFLPTRSTGFKKLNPEDERCAICKEVHYIPEGKDTCLKCIRTEKVAKLNT